MCVLSFLLSLLLLWCSAACSFAYMCSSNRDCSLNGLCNISSGMCECDAAWSGDDCGVLHLLPATRGTGFNYTSQGLSSWGGRIIDDPFDSTVHHLFLAVMENNCTLDNWVTNSKIVHAVSTNGRIDGPYTAVQDLFPSFHHNPTVILNPYANPQRGEGRYLLFCIGTEFILQPYDCSDGTVYPGWPGWPYESGIMLYSTDDLNGPWKFHGYVLGNNSQGTWDQDTTNPSPVLLNDGSLLLMYRGCEEGCGGTEMIDLAWGASPYELGYKRLYEQPIFTNANEDPFIYQDKRGNFHALFHSLESGGGFGGPNIGRHAYTDDPHGFSGWTFNSRTLAFNVSVHYTDGSWTDLNRRERPQLYFNTDTGEPMYLISGAQEKGTAMSYTLVQPINMKSKNWSQRDIER